MLSGVALTVSNKARPDGPDSGGASALFTLQPAAVRRASAIVARRMDVKDMVLEVPKVAELDLQLPCCLNAVADAVDTVESDPGDRRNEIRAGPKLRERCFLLGHIANQLEAQRQRAAGQDRAGYRGVERERHID